MSDSYDGDKFFTVENGQRIATPLLLALAVVELSDVVFAVDSVPAVSQMFARDQQKFLRSPGAAGACGGGPARRDATCCRLIPCGTVVLEFSCSAGLLHEV